jgi:tetratricopeptide (TPR) repeat protein
MYRLIALLLLLIATTPSCVQTRNIQQPMTGAIPELRVINDNDSAQLKIAKLAIDVVVTGNMATTTFDITYYNPYSRILEGELDVPLADGQTIARYALEVNGAMREGVVVEKVKARVAFENTVRQNIDPGLVEKTRGNSFRTRIYPIPVNGYKRIIIATEQALKYVDDHLFYQLPLSSSQPFADFSMKVTVLKSPVEPKLDNGELTGFAFKKWHETYTASFSQKDFITKQSLAFYIPSAGNNASQVFTEKKEDKTFFYCINRFPVQHTQKTRPATIGILWDVSTSAEKRNIEKELDIVQQYIRALKNVAVQLIPFNISTQATERFSIEDGNTDALIKKMKSLYFDGGTQLGAIRLADYPCEELLLFSDGLSTFGKKEMLLGKQPVIAITSSPVADYGYLKYIAWQTNGRFIDLAQRTTKDVIGELTQQSTRFINVVYNKAEIEELVTQGDRSLANGFSMAGILKAPSSVVTLLTGYGNIVTDTRKITLVAEQDSSQGNIKRLWASLKISELEWQYEKNKEAISQLGKECSIVTRNTSLLVLDRVEDYVQYEIVPPAELQKEYYALLKEQERFKADEKATALNEALDAMQALKTWWNKKFDLSNKSIKEEAGSLAAAVDTTVYVMDSTMVAVDTVAHFHSNSTPEATADAAMITTLHYGVTDKLEEAKISNQAVMNEPSDIELNEWKPNAAYLKILEETPDKDRFAKYLELKKQYAQQPSFYADVARFFAGRNNKVLALQVLSNIAEMKLEDPELLRIMAGQLMEMEATDLAIETNKEILSIREEEPQAYRDLALVYNDAGNYQEAVNLLYRLVTGTWDGRFGDVKSIALNEMNAIISAHPQVDVSSIDKRFIYAMPVDVRLVIGWSSNNADVDVWITDPLQEKCSYQNNNTRIGGKLSKDVTQGYGPEEYCLKKAARGDYLVEVNLYGDSRQTLGGPITVKADLFTDFGKASQKRKTINVRVTSDEKVIKIGALKFGS